MLAKKAIIDSMMEFSSFGTPKMKKIVLIYLACKLGENSFIQMTKYFNYIDKDKNGTIQLYELRNFL